MSTSSLQYYVLICDRKKKKKFIELVASYGGVSIDTMYGTGSVKSGAIARALGLATEERKVVITSLMPTQKAVELTEVLKSDYDFHKSNTGFAFSIALGGLSI